MFLSFHGFCSESFCWFGAFESCALFVVFFRLLLFVVCFYFHLILFGNRKHCVWF